MANVDQYTEYQVSMRDGYDLLTRVWMPEGDSPFHTILERGYEAGWPTHPERFIAAGYAYVGQQSRGTLEKAECFEWTMSMATTALTG